MEKQRYSSTAAGGVNAFGIDRITSGLPDGQPPSNVRGGGKSAAFPSRIPPSTHFAIVSISLCAIARVPAKSPQPAAAFHGGICRVCVMYLIASACSTASPYVISENGAMSSG
jgi:hypothetical protein